MALRHRPHGGSAEKQTLTKNTIIKPRLLDMTLLPRRLETLFTGVCQILGIGLAVLFGVYTVLSFHASEQASAEAQLSNKIALLDLCQNFAVCFALGIRKRFLDALRILILISLI